MVAEKVFVSCLIALVLFNFVFYVSGLNPDLLSVGSLIGIFITIGGIAVVVSVIPFLNTGGSVSWFGNSLIMLGLFYSVGFDVLSYHVQIGIGLASNLTNMFNSDLNSITFMPYLFFLALGVVGTLAGIIMMSGGTTE